MGPSRISLKDEVINNLEAQLEAHKTKIGLLQQRLMSALDTLDRLQSQYSLELDAEAHKRRHAETKLRRYMDTVQAAEVERDDLRDAVMKLVMKVESGNDDFNSWPRSHMRISSLLDPLAPTNNTRLDEAASRDVSEDQLLSYAGAIIDTLRHECDLARVTHAHFREMFEDRIQTLEAQLARRDAELETHVGHLVLEANAAPRILMQNEKRSRKEPVSMAQEEVMIILQRTSARNKTLEEEIKGLFKRLEQVRITKSTTSPSLSLPAQPSPPPADTELRTETSPVQAPDAQLDPLPAIPEPLTMDIHTQSLHNHDVATEMADHNNYDPRHHHPTVEHLNQEITELSARINAFKAERDALLEVIASQRNVAGLPSATRYQQHSSELELEPEATGAMIQPYNALEDECISLRHIVQLLREELREARINAKRREQELLERIEHMERRQGLANTVAPNADGVAVMQEGRVPKTDDLLDAYDGEMSMELATPLFPISLLPPSPSPHHTPSRPQSRSSRSHTRSPHSKSTLISSGEGSGSPRMIPPRILSSPSPSWSQSSSSTTPLSPPPQPPPDAPPPTFIQDFPPTPVVQPILPLPLPADSISTISVQHPSIEWVERELAAEQRRLQEGEQQLAELRNMLHDLHEQHRMSGLG